MVFLWLNDESLFFMPSDGGESYYENQNYFGMHRVQTEKLQHHQRKEEPSGQNGIQKVLQVLQDPHVAQRNEVR